MSKNNSLRYIIRTISYFTCLLLIYNILLPIRLNSSNQGPVQPEYTGFEPVGNTQMVDEFTGQFTYNIPIIEIPGPQGSSFPLSISYHSGQSPDADASWVGYGWTLNPGAIIRNTKGFPDDYKGTEVTFINKPRQNITTKAYYSVAAEFRSKDDYGGSLSSQYALAFNTLGSFTKEVGFSLGGGYLYYRGDYGYNSSGEHTYGFATSSILKGKLRDLISSMQMSDVMTSVMGSVANNIAVNTNSKIRGLYEDSPNNSYTLVNHEYEGTHKLFTLNGRLNFTTIGVGVSTSVPFMKEVMTNNPIELVSTKSVYGYLYSGNVDKENSIMDYYCENESNSYSEDDKFLPIPFSNPDVFSVTAPGLGGSFRFWNKNIGTFRPNLAESETQIYKGEFELNYVSSPPGGGVGGGFTRGKNSSSVQGNNLVKRSFAEYGKEDNAVFATFINDKGGSLEYSSRDVLLGYNPENNSFDESTSHTYLNKRNKSKFIGFNLNHIKPGLDATNIAQNIDLYCPDPAEHIINSTSSAVEVSSNTIKEFNIVNENGVSYTYGLPVYSRNEYNINYGLNQFSKTDFLDEKWFNKIIYLAKEPVVENNEVITGTIKNEAYASSYLLTSITGANYVDVDLNGVSEHDLGSWTKFNYRRAYGGKYGEWYKWRQPYSGLLYNRGSKSDFRDDVGSYASGEKEIYYLGSVETKTHIAYFVTNKTEIKDADDNILISGSDSPRKDAYPALNNEASASKSKALPINNHLEYLEKIILYPKTRNGDVDYDNPIKTVNFQYDYSAWPGQQNSKNGVGKLTLKRIWFEYGNEKPNAVSPYQFAYAYDDDGDGDIEPSEINYSDYHIIQELVPNGADERPNYHPNIKDAWGSYNPKQKERFLEDRLFLSQYSGYYKNIDLSAWQLKRIKIPTGGEINVQYEPKTYDFVQNKRPKMAFTLMTKDAYTEKHKEIMEEVVSLENNEVAVDLSDNLNKSFDYDRYELFLNEEYISKNKKVYFKFLYKLWENEGIQNRFKNNTINLPQNQLPNTDYIDGYCSIKSVEHIGHGLFKFKLQTGDNNEIIPTRVAKAKVEYNKYYQWYDPERGADRKYPFDDGATFKVKYLNEDLAKKYIELGNGASDKDINTQTCTNYYENYSYLRLPMPEEISKMGGGLRVKRIILVDDMNPAKQEDERDNIYGMEYEYEEGVASTETFSIPEDNSLREHIQKNTLEGNFDKWLAGRNYYIYEMPFGETLLPAPNVSYGKVRVKPIFSSLTNPHIKQKEFNTYKDYPFFIQSLKQDDYAVKLYKGAIGSQYSDLKTDSPFYNSINDFTKFGESHSWDEENIVEEDKKKDTIVNKYGLGLGLSFKQEKLKVAQGYRYIIQNMHGTMDKESSFILKYDEASKKFDTILTGSTEYKYFNIGEEIPLFDGNSISYGFPGKQQEIIFEVRKQNESYWTAGAEGDFSFSFPFAFDISASTSYAQKKKQIEMVTSSSVIRYPAIVKEVLTTSKEKLLTSASNVAFDPQSGNPVIKKITDEYHDESSSEGKVYNISLPANDIYEGIGQKSLREGVIVASDDVQKIYRRVEKEANSSNYLYSLKFDFMDKGKSGSHAINVNNILPGDLIKVYAAGDVNQRNPEYYDVKSAYGDYVYLEPLMHNGSLIPNIPKSPIINVVDVKIVRSIRKNILGTSVGNLSTYQDDNWIDNMNYTREKVFHPHYSSDSLAKVVFVKTLNAVLNQYKNIQNNVIIPESDFISELTNQISATSGLVSGSSEIRFIDFMGDTVNVTLNELISKISIEHLAPLEICVGSNINQTPIPSNPHVFILKVERDLKDKISSSSGSSGIIRTSSNDVYLSELNDFLQNMWSYRFSGTSNVLSKFEEHKLEDYKRLGLIKELYKPSELSSGGYKVFKANSTYSNKIYNILGFDLLKSITCYPFSYNGKLYTSKKELLSEIDILFAVDINTLVSQDDFDLHGNCISSTIPKIKIVGAGLKIGDPSSSEWLGFVDIPSSSKFCNSSNANYALNTLNSRYSNASGNYTYGNKYCYDVSLSSSFPAITIDQDMFKIAPSTKLVTVNFANTITKDICEMVLSGSPGIDKVKYSSAHQKWLYNPKDLGHIYSQFEPFLDQSIEYFKIDESNHGLLICNNVNAASSYFHPTYSSDSLEKKFSSFGSVYFISKSSTSANSILTSTDYKDLLHETYVDSKGRNFQNLFYIAKDITPLEFAHKIYYQPLYTNILSASAVTLKDSWKNGYTNSGLSGSSISGNKGRWHVEGQYYFRNDAREDLKRSNVSKNISPKASYTSNLGDRNKDFRMIPWQFMSHDPALHNWRQVSKNLDYTLNGQVLEVEDMLQNKSCKSYIFKDQVPLYTATFANREEIFFTSFDEDAIVASPICLIDNFEILSEPHTGRYSAQQLNMHISIPVDKGFYALKFWFNSSMAKDVSSYNDLFGLIDEELIQSTGLQGIMKIENLSICADWVLASCIINPGADFTLDFKNFHVLTDSMIDDIALYPVESKVKFYVYNQEDLTIDAVFDNTHFATMYNYNSKKELTSIRKETYQGLKTISTSSINIPKISVFNSSGSKEFSSGAESSEIPISHSIYSPQINTMEMFKRMPSFESQKTEESSPQFDLLDINIGPDGIDLEMFKTPDIETIDEVKKKAKESLDTKSIEKEDFLKIDKNLKKKIEKSEIEEKASEAIDSKKNEIINNNSTQEVKIR